MDNNENRLQDTNKEETINSTAEANTDKEPEQAANAPVETEEDIKVQKKKKFWKELREWLVTLAIALLVVMIIRTFLFQLIRVDGHSMDDTLADGERLFVTILDVKLNGASRDDIVICNYPNRGLTEFVKRVVAVPGDQVYREKGVTHVVYETTDENGNTTHVDEMLDERYAAYYPLGSTDDYDAYTLGEDEYFVCGDNRYNSHDSRDWKDSDTSNDVGPITGNMIVGKVRTVIWPLNNIHSVS